jgi:hypothetical protein
MAWQCVEIVTLHAMAICPSKSQQCFDICNEKFFQLNIALMRNVCNVNIDVYNTLHAILFSEYNIAAKVANAAFETSTFVRKI